MTFNWSTVTALERKQKGSATIFISYEKEAYVKIKGGITLHRLSGTDSSGNDVTQMYSLQFVGLDQLEEERFKDFGHVNLPVECEWSLNKTYWKDTNSFNCELQFGSNLALLDGVRIEILLEKATMRLPLETSWLRLCFCRT